MIQLIKKLRILFLIHFIWSGYQFGKNLHIGLGVRFWAKKQLLIGDNVYIGHGSLIQADCIIGNDVMFANNVAVVGKYDHNFQEIGVPIRRTKQIRDKDYNWKGINLKTIIGDDVWIGYGSIIMSGITIGTGCIVAAGSVVTKNLDPYCIYGGVPARKIGKRFETEVDEAEHIKILSTRYPKKLI